MPIRPDRLFALVLVALILVVHAQQIQMLSGSLKKFWLRKDRKARWSQALLLFSVAAALASPAYGTIAIVISGTLLIVHVILSMEDLGLR